MTEQCQEETKSGARYGMDPPTNPRTISNADYDDIAREVLTELAEHLDGTLWDAITPAAVRSWRDEHYPGPADK